jgi:hypothetical protein
VIPKTQDDPRGKSGCMEPKHLPGVTRCGIRRESVLINLLLNGWIEAARFGADVQHVMALRMRRLALGGPLAVTEARQMFSEKVAAFGEAQGAIMTSLAAGRSLDAAAVRAYGPYRRRVRANRRRLAFVYRKPDPQDRINQGNMDKVFSC